MRSSSSFRAGFTLVEMLVAIGIFVLLVGAIYMVVSVSVSATANLATDQIEARRRGVFQDFLRRGFYNLPFEAEIALRARSKGSLGQGLELVMRPAAGAFEIGSSGEAGGGVVLATVPDGHGKNFFGIARFPSRMEQDELTRHLESAQWLPLLNQVDSVKWRFWDKNLNSFVETWDQGTQHPELIELTFVVAGEPTTTCLFRLPSLAQMSVKAPSPPPK